MSDVTPLTILGAPDAEGCVDDVCLIPSPEARATQPAGGAAGSVRSATTAPNDAMSASESTNAL